MCTYIFCGVSARGSDISAILVLTTFMYSFQRLNLNVLKTQIQAVQI